MKRIVLALVPLFVGASILIALTFTSPLALSQTPVPGPGHFRPPAVPLIACDPYFSVWSFADRLTDDYTRHWTGARQSLESMVKIDGKTYRIMGKAPETIPAMSQVSLDVLPTRTTYNFEAQGVEVEMTFMTPMLLDDPEAFARPVTYAIWQVHATDGREHAVSIYYDNSAELVVNTPNQTVVWSREKISGLDVLRMGSEEQPVLAKCGDDLRIDWGYLYAASPHANHGQEVIASNNAARQAFINRGSLPTTDDRRMPRPVNDDWPVMAFVLDLGKVGSTAKMRHIILAYDDLYSIEYFHQRLRPYWRRNGADAGDLLRGAEQDYGSLRVRCAAFDRELLGDLRRVGGEKYATLCALAYRQSLAACKLVADSTGAPLFMSKETFSDGSIDTVDVSFPTSPVLLLFNSNLLRAALVPVLDYAGSGQWPFVFPPAQLGTYPVADGQTYGGREKSVENQMPVEESGNMLIMVAALARTGRGAHLTAKYWPLLTQWANYLKHKGLDPENQLCTDDYAGHLAHNANLSVKAIEGLAAYALLCDLRGDKQEAAQYRQTAEQFARQWIKKADDGDHTRLAFDQPGTWSEKYNLVWDEVLGLKLFPPEVAKREVAYYERKMNRFGFPLDSRKTYTMPEWEIWCATMAESPADFRKLVAPVYDFANQTPDRVPLADWSWSTDGRQVHYMKLQGKPIGFQARSTVGGFFIKMLTDAPTWRKWSSRAK